MPRQASRPLDVEYDQHLPFEMRASAIRPPVVEGATAAEWAGWFKALSDPTRLRVVALLAGNMFPLCAGDIARCLGISPATLSHHLKVLRAAELVVTNRCGHLVYCSLMEEGLLKGLAALARLVPEQRHDARWRRRQWRMGLWSLRLRT